MVGIGRLTSHSYFLVMHYYSNFTYGVLSPCEVVNFKCMKQSKTMLLVPEEFLLVMIFLFREGAVFVFGVP